MMELKQKQVLITIWIIGKPECQWSVADQFNITKSILFRVYCRICGAIANNLTGQYMKYLLVWSWAPLGRMINAGSFAQRNMLDQWSNDPSLAHADQWSDESLSGEDLIDHWSENRFSCKERHRSEILIRILPKECTQFKSLIMEMSLCQNLFYSSLTWKLTAIQTVTSWTMSQELLLTDWLWNLQEKSCWKLMVMIYLSSMRTFSWLRMRGWACSEKVFSLLTFRRSVAVLGIRRNQVLPKRISSMMFIRTNIGSIGSWDS